MEANKAVRIARSQEVSLTFRYLGDDIAVVGWSDAGLFDSVGVELDEAKYDLVLSLGSKKMLYSQKGCMVGIARECDLERTHEVPVNIMGWKSKTNRRIVESTFAAETHAAMMGYGRASFLRSLILEIKLGEWAIKDDSANWNTVVPLVLSTDCKSVFDCVKCDRQSVSDKSDALNIAIFRQMCSAESNPSHGRAQLLRVPTRHQLADGLTKAGLQQVINGGKATFHGKSARAVKSTVPERSDTNVNVQPILPGTRVDLSGESIFSRHFTNQASGPRV